MQHTIPHPLRRMSVRSLTKPVYARMLIATDTHVLGTFVTYVFGLDKL